jgi:hypothetical protein
VSEQRSGQRSHSGRAAIFEMRFSVRQGDSDVRIAPFAILLVLSTYTVGCGPVLPTDAGEVDDAGAADGGTPDGGVTDGGVADGGDRDGGEIGLDAGGHDGGNDAGTIACDAVLSVDDTGLDTHTLEALAPLVTCTLTLAAGDSAAVVDVTAPGGSLVLRASVDGPVLTEREPGFLGPFVVSAQSSRTVEITRASGGIADLAVSIRRRGSPANAIDEARSLVWTDPSLVDDAATVGLSRVMAAMSDDAHGGRLLQHWLLTFGTTAHSSRAGPGLLVEEHALAHGDDASAWDLSELPFQVTGVHTRMDLRNSAHCGELRVSLASTHGVYRPLHLLFLFAFAPREDDVTPSGALHCSGTALRLARLSTLSSADFNDAARAILDEGLVAERFLLAESVEFIISPWEWRQWVKVPNTDVATSALLPFVVDNPPLFQTVDIPAVNTPGPKRDAFLTFVEANAPALAARSLLWPESFRAPSFRLNDGVPWVPVDLNGVDADVLASFPTLAGQIAITGCPACHTADAQFVHTREDRTFSPFYTKELVARAALLDALQRGVELHVPFGPLQDEPNLP